MSFIRVTLDFSSQAELLAFFAGKPATEAAAKVEAPKSTKAEKAAATATAPASSTATQTSAPAAATQTGTVSSLPEEKADPKPAAAATAPAPAAAQTASSDVAMTEADLTKVVVATVARVGKEKTLKLLQDEFNVTAGKQITDPAIRAKAKTALEAL